MKIKSWQKQMKKTKVNDAGTEPAGPEKPVESSTGRQAAIR